MFCVPMTSLLEGDRSIVYLPVMLLGAMGLESLSAGYESRTAEQLRQRRQVIGESSLSSSLARSLPLSLLLLLLEGGEVARAADDAA